MNCSSDTVPERFTILNNDTKGSKYNLYPNLKRGSKVKLIVKIKHINHSYSLEISVRMMGDNVDYNILGLKQFVNIAELLTLAYM